MKRSEIIFSLLQIPLDFLMVVLAGFAAYWLRISDFVSRQREVLFFLPFDKYFLYLLIGGTLSILAFALAGLYQLKSTRPLTHELFLILVALSAGVVAVAFYLFLTANPFESRFIVIAWWLFAMLFVSLTRAILKYAQRFLITRYGIGAHNVLLIGHPNPGRSKEFLATLKNNPRLGFRVVAEALDIKMNKIGQIIRQCNVDDVFLTDLSYSQEKILELADFCHRMQVNFSFIPSEFGSFRTQLKTFPTGLAILEVKHTTLDGWGKIIKRGVDIVCALCIMVLFSPVALLIALLIKIDSSGPVLVRLKRVREGEKPFFIYKFRSMKKDAHKMKFTLLKKKNERSDGPLFKIKNDPRVTRVGKFLRRFHLDEFPQLINVLRSEMSLVGPRPHEPEEIAHYRKHHLRLLSMKPGISGLAQVSGASRLLFEREAELDIYYIEHWSLTLDFYILVRTFVVMLSGKEN